MGKIKWEEGAVCALTRNGAGWSVQLDFVPPLAGGYYKTNSGSYPHVHYKLVMRETEAQAEDKSVASCKQGAIMNWERDAVCVLINKADNSMTHQLQAIPFSDGVAYNCKVTDRKFQVSAFDLVRRKETIDQLTPDTAKERMLVNALLCKCRGLDVEYSAEVDIGYTKPLAWKLSKTAVISIEQRYRPAPIKQPGIPWDAIDNTIVTIRIGHDGTIWGVTESTGKTITECRMYIKVNIEGVKLPVSVDRPA